MNVFQGHSPGGATARQKARFCVSPFPSPRQPHPDPHPMVHFPFSSLCRFLPQFDGQYETHAIRWKPTHIECWYVRQNSLRFHWVWRSAIDNKAVNHIQKFFSCHRSHFVGVTEIIDSIAANLISLHNTFNTHAQTRRNNNQFVVIIYKHPAVY